MKKFVAKLVLYFFLLGLIFFGFATWFSVIVKGRGFAFWQTESILLPLKPGHYDIVFQGNSHARMFARNGNYRIVDSILGTQCYNMGRQGGRTGIDEHYFYLNYVLSHGLSFDTLVFTISSPVLFSNHSNLSSLTFQEEPVDYGFLWEYIFYKDAQNKWSRIFYYFRTKFSVKWLSYKPVEPKPDTRSLKHIDSAAIEKGLQLAFPYGIDTVAFKRNSRVLENIIRLAQSKNMKVIFITTPVLFDHWPEHDRIVSYMRHLEKEYGVRYYDFSSAIKDPRYFADHHHLNSEGVKLFTEQYLKPALKSSY